MLLFDTCNQASQSLNLGTNLIRGPKLFRTHSLVKKIISTSNNAFAAAWSGGSNDQSLPMDIGKIISEYPATVIPAQR